MPEVQREHVRCRSQGAGLARCVKGPALTTFEQALHPPESTLEHYRPVTASARPRTSYIVGKSAVGLTPRQIDHDDADADDVVGGYRATTAVADHVKVSAFLDPAVITRTHAHHSPASWWQNMGNRL